MPSIALEATGTLFQIVDEITPVTVPEVARISPPNISFELLDATTHDSTGGFREWVPGLLDGESSTIEFNLVPSNAVHKQLRDANLEKTKLDVQFVFPDTSDNTMAFAAFVMSFGQQADVGQLLRGNCNIRMTGQPTWS